MTIAIISDTHGYCDRVKLAMEKFFADVDLVIHGGDVLTHGARNPHCMPADGYNPLALAELINNLKVPVIIARGNNETELDEEILNVPITPYAHVFANGKRIVVTHGHHVPTDADKDKMAAHVRADVFVTGHIHKPVLERRNGIVFLNPGTVSQYLTNEPNKRTSVALLDETKIQIFDLDTGEAFMSLEL